MKVESGDFFLVGGEEIEKLNRMRRRERKRRGRCWGLLVGRERYLLEEVER